MVIDVPPVDPSEAKKEELKSLMPNFLRRRAEDVERVRAAIAIDDFSVVATIGHNLRGSGASYGFPELSAIGAAIEKGALDGDAASVAREVASLAEALSRITGAMPTK
jgi:HPt (histidine-containing phosphotransfer) domain-containing protein